MDSRRWGQEIYANRVRLGIDAPEAPLAPRVRDALCRAIVCTTNAIQREGDGGGREFLTRAATELFFAARLLDVDLEEQIQQEVIRLGATRKVAAAVPAAAPTAAQIQDGSAWRT